MVRFCGTKGGPWGETARPVMSTVNKFQCDQ